MQSNYDKAFELVIGHEGGFTDHRKDRGNWTSGRIGVGQLKGTKYGISAMAYPHLDIKNLTLDQSKAIYKKDYWDKVRADELPSGLDYLAFDMAVNHGTKQSIMFIQEALRVSADGRLGPITLGAIMKTPTKQLVTDIAIRRMLFYTNIKTWSTFKGGWTRRAFETLVHALDLVGAPLDQSKPEEPNDDTQPTFFGLFRRV